MHFYIHYYMMFFIAPLVCRVFCTEKKSAERCGEAESGIFREYSTDRATLATFAGAGITRVKKVHHKKSFLIFPSPAGIIKLFPLTESLVSDILAWDRNIEKLFLRCRKCESWWACIPTLSKLGRKCRHWTFAKSGHRQSTVQYCNFPACNCV